MVVVFVTARAFLGNYDDAIRSLISAVSAGIVGVGAFLFRTTHQELFFRSSAGLSQESIKILVYGHSGSGKSTFIENSLSYEEARPPETFDFVKDPLNQFVRAARCCPDAR